MDGHNVPKRLTVVAFKDVGELVRDTWLPLPRYSAAFSACLPQAVQRIEAASSSRCSPAPRRVLLMAMKVARATLPSRPWTQSSRTDPARCALRCSTRTNAMMGSSKRRTRPDTALVFLKTGSFCLDSSLPPTGGRGVGRIPSFTGRGWGWVVYTAAEAVSRFPGPPRLLLPPQVPLTLDGGAAGGSAVGRPAHAAAFISGRRSSAKPTADDTSGGGSAADVTPSAATGAADEPLRALQ